MNTVSNELFEIMSENLDVRTEYSGRCMYGEVCFGFVSYNIFQSIGEILFQINHDPYLVEEFGELLQVARTDNMGNQTIVYFPNFQVEIEE